jgi:hypothetical protein
MNRLYNLRSRPWILPTILVGLVASHGILFYLLRHSLISHVAVPSAIASLVVFLIVAKHLRLFAALLRYVYTVFRRRS